MLCEHNTNICEYKIIRTRPYMINELLSLTAGADCSYHRLLYVYIVPVVYVSDSLEYYFIAVINYASATH